MPSLYRQLAEKLSRDPRLTKKGGARADLGLLLFNARDDIAALWEAAERFASAHDVPGELRETVEALRPIFGER